ncbi:MAG: hypothetical protein CMP21_05720 [Rickettsiales bacterium]|nr:hypothetical protein [Rickettsiales bacterium]|tara:strand:+ start:1583 stop:1870 length:288 start_codon:yes stop_codon:yes gene_type:complete
MAVVDFIKNNSVYIAIILPVAYFVFRDLYAAYRERRNLEKNKQAIIESEKRIYELIKQTDQNKVDLINQLASLKKKVDSSLSDIDNEINDKQKNA